MFGVADGTSISALEESLMVAVLAPLPDGPLARPRPVLRLVDDVTWVDDVGPEHWGAGEDIEGDLSWLSVGTDVAVRRRRRAARQVRRRRVLAASAVIGALVLLALPVRALAGQTVPVASAPPSLTAGSVYVVQPGDTLWTIAVRLDPSGDPRTVVAQLEAETGTDHVVPGEHLHLP
jgi:hypothetical protein